MPRPGTSLAEQILASHPLVFGAGELTVLEDMVNTVCPECMLDLGRNAFDRMGADYVATIREYSSGAEYITDKTLYNCLYVGLVRTILPGAKIIHCTRNPINTCFSIFKNDFMDLNG